MPRPVKGTDPKLRKRPQHPEPAEGCSGGNIDQSSEAGSVSNPLRDLIFRVFRMLPGSLLTFKASLPKEGIEATRVEAS